MRACHIIYIRIKAYENAYTNAYLFAYIYISRCMVNMYVNTRPIRVHTYAVYLFIFMQAHEVYKA